MKKVLGVLALAGCVLGMGMTADAMDSATLRGDPGKYRIVLSDNNEVVYADAATIEKSGDNAALPVVKAKVYAEITKRMLKEEDFKNKTLVGKIFEFDVTITPTTKGAKHRKYEMDKKLVAIYSPDGTKLERKAPGQHEKNKTEEEGKKVMRPHREMEHNSRRMYINLLDI